MNRNHRGRKLLGLLSLLIYAFIVYRLLLMANGTGGEFSRFSPLWVYRLGAAAAILSGGLVLSAALLWFPRPARALERLTDAWERLGHLRIPVLAAAALLPTWLIFDPFPGILQPIEMRFLLFFVGAMWIGLLLPVEEVALPGKVALVFLVLAVVHIFAARLILVTDYPFKLGWSEGNRHWDHSLFFEHHRYDVVGEFQYPSYITPGRHGLWGLIYLIPGVSIQLARLWDVVLWTGPYFLLGLSLFWRSEDRLPGWLGVGLVLWAVVYLSQGPIYAPLILSAAILAFGYRSGGLARGLAATAVACFYAGISRWTWLVAPAIWAVVWSMLDSDQTQIWWRRLRTPAAYGLAGLVGAAASQVVMALAFPRPNPIYATAASQDLLWYRLWPSATNPMGIVPGMLAALLPAVILLIWMRSRDLIGWDWLTFLPILAAVGAFAAVGLAASVKIGGGNNLHNLDMLFVAVLLVLASALWEAKDNWSHEMRLGRSIAQILAAFLIAVPVWSTLRMGALIQLPEEEGTRQVLAQVEATAIDMAQSGEVLFIDQRQLFTFGHLDEVPLVMEYELKDLMNQAMGNNRAYLDGFETDLRQERFSLIVVHPLNRILKGMESPFGEENDAWVTNVSVPMLEYYAPIAEFNEFDIWLMAPIHEP